MLLLQLFALQFEYGFMSSLKWISPAENVVADAISRPSREAIIRIAPAAFRAIWDEMGPFNVEFMACTASVLLSPVSGEALPFISHYDCAGSAGTDLLAQDTSIVPGTPTPAFGFCFPSPVTAGHIAQHLAECKAYHVVRPSARFQRVLIPFRAARQSEVDRGGPGGGGGRLLLVGQPRCWP